MKMVWITLSLRFDDGTGNEIGRISDVAGPTLESAIDCLRAKVVVYNAEVRAKRPQFKKPAPPRRA